jgi:N6-adenosine-specific RNA methylase IME4
MTRRLIGKKPMTPAQKQKRYRENKKPTSTISRQRRRAEREAALGAATARAWQQLDAPERVFPVLYADFPWRIEPWSRQTGLARAADEHYPTMTLDEIKTAMIRLPAAKNCVLFIWIAAELLDEIKDLLAAQGFKYRSHCIWLKTGKPPGLGRWFRFKHEVLVVAARGEIPAPAPGENWDSVIEAPWEGHSRKPEVFAEMITAYYPTAPKLEMFYRPLDDPELERARQAKREAAGWHAWGNEAVTDAAYDKGREAYRTGKPRSANPYPLYSAFWREWNDAWDWEESEQLELGFERWFDGNWLVPS